MTIKETLEYSNNNLDHILWLPNLNQLYQDVQNETCVLQFYLIVNYLLKKAPLGHNTIILIRELFLVRGYPPYKLHHWLYFKKMKRQWFFLKFSTFDLHDLYILWSKTTPFFEKISLCFREFEKNHVWLFFFFFCLWCILFED